METQRALYLAEPELNPSLPSNAREGRKDSISAEHSRRREGKEEGGKKKPKKHYPWHGYWLVQICALNMYTPRWTLEPQALVWGGFSRSVLDIWWKQIQSLCGKLFTLGCRLFFKGKDQHALKDNLAPKETKQCIRTNRKNRQQQILVSTGIRFWNYLI